MIADQTARRGMKDNAGFAGAGGAHIGHFAFALRDFIDHGAGIGVVDIDGDFLDRLQLFAILGTHQHPRAADGQFEAFAAHGFDQHAELQFAAAGHFEIAIAGFGDLERDIAFGFAQQALTDDAALHLVAFAAGIGAVIDRDGHGQGRRVDGVAGNGRVHGQIAQGVGNGSRFQARDGDQVAGFHTLHRHASEAPKGQQLGDAGLFDDLAVAAQRLDVAAHGDDARFNAAGENTAQERVGFQGGDQHLEGMFVAGQFLRLGRRHVFDNALEQRRQILALVFQLIHRPAIAARGIEVMEIELVIIGFQRQEQIENGFQGFLGHGIVTVNLVDDHDRLEAQLQRLGQHEFGLGHHGFRRVHQQHHAIHHRENAFDFAAEVGMAGGIHRVDARALPFNRGAFGQNGDAALTLLVVGVHGALFHMLIFAHRAGLLEQLVYERGLAVVDMRDDRNVANFHESNVFRLAGAS